MKVEYLEGIMDNYFYNPALLSLTKIRDRGTNSENVLNQNRRLILQLIKDAGVISRKTLAEKTGLKLATITLAINEFLEKGMIEERGFIEGDSGRKIMGFGFASEKYCTIVIRISTSYIKIGVYDINNNNLFIKKIFLDTLSNINHTCELIANHIENLPSVIEHRKVLGVGVGVEGPFVLKDGYYKLPHPQSADGYFDIGKVLANKLKYPVFINKENNFAVYNLWKTKCKDKQLGIVVNITVSYAIECGIMVNGEIVNGCCGSAGLLGRVLIGENNLGHGITVQDQASSTTVIKRVLDSLDQYPNSLLVLKRDDLNIRDVIKAFNLDDELAVAVFTDVGILLGRTVANLVNILNPDLIKIGDEIPATPRMQEIIENEARRYIAKDVSTNLFINIMDFESARDTKHDPSLLGASTYITDAFVQSLDFGE
jgi:predicted NBD/HSP70 family sugar kinase